MDFPCERIKYDDDRPYPDEWTLRDHVMKMSLSDKPLSKSEALHICLTHCRAACDRPPRMCPECPLTMLTSAITWIGTVWVPPISEGEFVDYEMPKM